MNSVADCASLQLLTKARRVRGNRGKFAHTKHIMQSLMREKDTLRVRQIKPGEEVPTLFDELAGPNAEFWVKTSNSQTIRTSEDIAPGVSPYTYYNDTDAAEDAVLFDEDSLNGLPEDMEFVEITIPMRQLESSRLPLSVLNRTVKNMEATIPPALEKALGLHRRIEGAPSQAASNPTLTAAYEEYDPGSEQFPFSVPPIWEQAHKSIADTCLGPDRAGLLERLDFHSIKFTHTVDELNRLVGKQEMMERDRAYGNLSCRPSNPI